ncbi:bifunctional 2-C-methyl-D-erythritol 4-phosphate cytidylyltransferase/2-C-methyl-D-erythritol 2,4-cyclodiphosphate synthase [Roseovarius phycicola]|uniref:Bifunctional enzyme IspD/IspF n=1 Tax=Roseovarius phycicola TaxID=3080976 RepID=A0ABZ2HE17_9RHOB
MTIAAIIVAAGRGARAGGDSPKQWQILAGRRVIDWTLDAFAKVDEISRIQMVLHPKDMDQVESSAKLNLVAGGKTRAGSVLNGLESLVDSDVKHVLIHDAARCCITPELIRSVIAALDNPDGAGAALALPVTDALWQGDADLVDGARSREGLYRAQTPQAFPFEPILAAHRAADTGAADDVEVARAAGINVRIVPGAETNLKITTPDDFARAEQILRGPTVQTPLDIRTGTGFDVHRFGPGDHVMLCGVDIPHDRGLQGHSDADVALHTVTDALYGALAEGDIGRHFPPSDPQWKGAESHIFLRHAVDLAAEKGFRITNVDLTLICEQPKIGPQAPAMITRLAEIMELDVGRVSVKATTSERLGFTGREEGIAAQAVVTVMSP